MESTRQYLQRRLQALKNEASEFVPLWQDLSDYVLPRGAKFNVTDKPGTKRNSKIMDNTATMSVRIGAAGMMSGLTSKARPWFILKTADDELNESKGVQVWLDEVRKIMSMYFLRSNLYSVLSQVYTELLVFGTSAFLVEQDIQKGIHCTHFPIGSYYLGTNDRGRVDTVFREFTMTRRQMVQKFGLDAVSNEIRLCYEAKRDLDVAEQIIHAIEPNPNFDERKPLAKHKAWRSVYFHARGEGDKLLRESGYNEFPVMAARWAITGEDVYGNSPAMDALGDIKALQTEQKSKTNLIQKGNTPPMGAPIALKNKKVSLLAGDLTFQDTSNGQQGVKPLYEPNPAWLSHLTVDVQDVQQRVKRAFYEDVFLMMSGDTRSNVTAEEIRARQEERMLMLGPVVERMGDDLLDPLIERTFSILMDMKALPPPPEELANQNLNVEYISIMSQVQKLQTIQGLEKMMAFAGQVASVNPQVLDKINFDEVVDQYGDGLGISPTTMLDDKEVEAVRQRRAQQEQAQQSMAMMQSMAGTAKDLGNTPITDENALGAMINRMGGGVAP